MKITNFKSTLISDVNIKKMNEVAKKTNYNIKRLLDNETLTQSQCIKFGNIFEQALNEFLKSNNIGLNLINTKLVKTGKLKKSIQIDLIFELNNKLYYFELKTNLNLDSEKSKATNDKLDILSEHFNLDLSKYSEINVNILSCWWEKEKGMDIKTNKNLYFMSDFFELISCNTNKDEYYNIMKEFGRQINQ
jgi:hypothetical protein